MTPPVFIDLTNDGIEDIVLASYNSTMHALDGDTYKELWRFTYPQSETYMLVLDIATHSNLSQLIDIQFFHIVFFDKMLYDVVS